MKESKLQRCHVRRKRQEVRKLRRTIDSIRRLCARNMVFFELFISLIS